MQIGIWHFQPNLWPSVATLVVFPLLLSLGFWQLDRAEQKEALSHSFEKRAQSRPVDLNVPSEQRDDREEMLWRNVTGLGSFDSGFQFLLDNQVVAAQTGYFVYTPFRLIEDAGWVLVNRGWVWAGTDRTRLPAVESLESVIEIRGTAKAPPLTGLLLGDETIEDMGGGTYRLQRLSLDELAGLTGLNLLSYVVRLDDQAEQGLVRKWRIPGSGKERHLGYAFQWFALATALTVIFIVVNLKRTKAIERAP
jgi:surfeit locus 1 family protein